MTGDFRYELTPELLRRYLLSKRGINILVPIIFLIILAIWQLKAILFPGIIFILIGAFPIGLFFSYYTYVKDKILIMSKGNDIFYFGTIHSLVKYDKKDIVKYTIVKTRGPRNMYNGFAVIKITFRNGTMLSIPNLLINDQALENKLFQCRKVYKDETPYL